MQVSYNNMIFVQDNKCFNDLSIFDFFFLFTYILTYNSLSNTNAGSYMMLLWFDLLPEHIFIM